MAEDQVTVVARLRDELSRPAKDVERETNKLRRALDRLGDSKVARSLGRLKDLAKNVGRGFGKLRTATRRLGRQMVDSFTNSRLARGLSTITTGIGNLIRLPRRAIGSIRTLGSRMATAFTNTRVGRGLSTLTSGIGRLGRGLGRLAGLARGAGAALAGPLALGAKAAAATVGGLVVAVAGGIGYGVKLASDLEQSQIAFTTMLGSGEKAKAFLDDLKKFAAKTPFELPGLIQGSRQLLAMGFAADEVMPTLTSVGDTVSALGLGQEGIETVVRALGQMKAKTKVSAEEMLQLAEAGIPAWEVLAQAMGKTVPQVQDLASEGKIGADVFISAFKNMEGPLAKFGGSMEAQSQTLKGLWSTLKDTVGMKLADVAAPLVEGLRDSLPAITEQLDGFLERIGPGLSQALATALPVLITLFTTLLEAIAPVIEIGAELAEDLMPVVAEVVEALQPFILDLATAFADLVRALMPLLPPLAEIIAKVGSGLVEAIMMLMPPVLTLVTLFVEELLPALMPLIPAFLELVTAVLPLLDPIVQLISALLPPLVSIITPLAGILADLANVLSAILTPAFQWIGEKLEQYVVPVIETVVGWFENLAGVVDRTVGTLSRAKSAVSDFTSGKTGGIAGRVTSWINPFGDTATPRTRGGDGGSIANLARTHGMFDLASAMTAGSGFAITSALRGPGGSGDHAAGKALDVTGPFTGALAATWQKMGGFAEHHGSGATRHLHLAAGDTATPRASRMPAMASATPVQGTARHYTVQVIGAGDPDAVADRVVAKIRRLERDERERSR